MTTKTEDNTSADELKTGYIKVQLDYAPEDEKEFGKWCEAHDFNYMGREGRGAWCSSLNTYFRGASGVAYADGEPFLFYEEDLFDLEAYTKQRELALLERLENTIEPFSHSDSQNSNDALRFVITVIQQEEENLNGSN